MSGMGMAEHRRSCMAYKAQYPDDWAWLNKAAGVWTVGDGQA